MAVEFTFLAGRRAGRSVSLVKPYLTIGRHPASDLRFGPDEDLEVSGRHAAVLLRDGVYLLRDLGSTNGTFVNGVRLRGDHMLADGDVLRFGAAGPEVRLHLEPAPVSTALAARAEAPAVRVPMAIVPDPGAAPAPRPARPTRPEGAPAEVTSEPRGRVRAARRTRVAVVGVVLVALLAAGGGIVLRRGTGGDERPRRIEPLRREVAGAIDGAAIRRANGAAVALVLAHYADGRTWSGTGFAVLGDAGGGYLVTTRHVVRDSAGAAATRLEVVFDGSGRSVPARIVAVHPTADIALARVERAGGVPVVRGLAAEATPVRVGDPVASLGFPLGLDLPMGGDWRRVGVSATLTAGTAARVLPGLLQIDGYGATGASGSPVFRVDGKVAGVIYGSERGSGGRIVYAAPARAVGELLAYVTHARRAR